VDQIRITGVRVLVSSRMQRYPRIPEQTENSRARTNGEMESRNVTGEKWGTEKSQLIHYQGEWHWSLEMCQKWQPQSSSTGNVILWNLGPIGSHAAQPYIAKAMRKKTAILMMQEIRIPRGSRFRVQREFKWKYPEYKCYIAAGSDID